MTRLLYALGALPAAVALPAFFLQIAPQALESPQVSVLALVVTLGALRLLDVTATLFIGPLSDQAGFTARRKAGWWLGALMMLIGLAPLMLADATHHLLPLALGGLLTTLGWAAMRVCHTAWGAELAPGYHARTRYYTAAQAVILAGLAAGIAAPWLAQEVTALRGQALFVLYLGVVAITLLCGLAMLRVPDTAAPAPGRGVGAALQRLARLRAVRRLLLAHGLNVAAQALPAALLLYLAGEVVGHPETAVPAAALHIAAALLGLPLGSALARRYGKHNTWCASLVLTAAVLVWIALLVPGAVAPLLVLATLTGLTLGVDWSLSAAIQADLTDVEAAYSGHRRSGLAFALWGVTGKIAIAVAAAVALMAAAYAGGPDPQTGHPGGALLLAAVAPAILKLLAMGLLWDFPVDEIRHEELQQRIAARRGDAERTAPPAGD